MKSYHEWDSFCGDAPQELWDTDTWALGECPANAFKILCDIYLIMGLSHGMRTMASHAVKYHDSIGGDVDFSTTYWKLH